MCSKKESPPTKIVISPATSEKILFTRRRKKQTIHDTQVRKQVQKKLYTKSLQSKRKKEKPSISMALRSKKVFTCWRKSCRTWERERERGSVGEVVVRTPFSFTCIEKK